MAGVKKTKMSVEALAGALMGEESRSNLRPSVRGSAHGRGGSVAGGLATDPSAYHVVEGGWLGGRSGGTISRGSAAESILGVKKSVAAMSGSGRRGAAAGAETDFRSLSLPVAASQRSLRAPPESLSRPRPTAVPAARQICVSAAAELARRASSPNATGPPRNHGRGRRCVSALSSKQ